jgi:hypothetical protein
LTLDLYPKLHRELLDQLGWENCEQCGEPSEYLRSRTEPAWGEGENGTPGEPLDLLAKVGRLIRAKNFGECASALANCERCLMLAIMPPASEKSGDPRVIRRLRMQALFVYGPNCDQCGAELKGAQSAGARLCLTPGNEQGVTNWNAKYELLEELEWPKGLCAIRCIQCTGLVTQSQRTPAKLSLRDKVLSGYGNHCVKCARTDQASLWVVRVTGPTLRHPGSGRKMSAAAKYRWLIENRFPASHVLMCPDCWADSRVGAGNGYEVGR